MFEVYNNGELEFVGNGRQVAIFIGINVRTLYGLVAGKTTYVPKKAKCDQLNHRGNTYVKKEIKNRNRKPIVVEIGYSINVGGDQYIITGIEERKSDVIYTINDDFKLRALRPYTNYITLYLSLKRRLKKCG